MEPLQNFVALCHDGRQLLQDQLEFMLRPGTVMRANKLGSTEMVDITQDWIARLRRHITEYDQLIAAAEAQLKTAGYSS